MLTTQKLSRHSLAAAILWSFERDFPAFDATHVMGEVIHSQKKTQNGTMMRVVSIQKMEEKNNAVPTSLEVNWMCRKKLVHGAAQTS